MASKIVNLNLNWKKFREKINTYQKIKKLSDKVKSRTKIKIFIMKKWYFSLDKMFLDILKDIFIIIRKNSLITL